MSSCPFHNANGGRRPHHRPSGAASYRVCEEEAIEAGSRRIPCPGEDEDEEIERRNREGCPRKPDLGPCGCRRPRDLCAEPCGRRDCPCGRSSENPQRCCRFANAPCCRNCRPEGGPGGDPCDEPPPCDHWNVDGFLRGFRPRARHVCIDQAWVNRRWRETWGGPIPLEPGVWYSLKEDICIGRAGTPTAEPEPSDGGHRALLRRSAVFSVAGRETVLDLKGHEIHVDYEFLDRHNPFLTIVQLASGPFLKGTGCDATLELPPLRSARRAVVMGGRLRGASHFCVQGAGSQEVALRNLELLDFEVGGASFTGASGIVVQRCLFKVRRDATRTPGASGVIEAAIEPKCPLATPSAPMRASTVLGVEANGVFFIGEPFTHSSLQQLVGLAHKPPQRGFFLEDCDFRDIAQLSILHHKIVYSADSPLVLAARDASGAIRDGPLAGSNAEVDGNIVMGDWEGNLDCNNAALLRRVAGVEQPEVPQGMSGDEVRALGFEPELEPSRTDNRTHGNKAVVAVRVRGMADVVIAGERNHVGELIADGPTTDYEMRVRAAALELSGCPGARVDRVPPIGFARAESCAGLLAAVCPDLKLAGSAQWLLDSKPEFQEPSGSTFSSVLFVNPQ